MLWIEVHAWSLHPELSKMFFNFVWRSRVRVRAMVAFEEVNLSARFLTFRICS